MIGFGNMTKKYLNITQINKLYGARSQIKGLNIK